MNLAFMKEQFAFAERLVIPGTAGHVLSDVGVDEKSAAGFEVHVGIANVGFAFAQGFHFGAVQDETGFQLFKNMVVVRRRAILRDDLFARLLGVLALTRFTGRLHHNLSFYLMPRLMRVSGKAASPGQPPPSYRSAAKEGVERKATGLVHGTV